MINILFLHAGAELYGADIILETLVTLLDKEMFMPHVILPCEGPLVERLKERRISVEVIPYPILRRKYFNPSGIISYFIDYIKYSKILAERASNLQIDIVHVNTTAVLEGIYITKKLHIPIVWHVHEIIVKPRIISKILSYLIAKYARETVVVSAAVKKHLDDTCKFKREIKVIYNGVDSKRFYPGNDDRRLLDELNISSDSKVVGMIGRVNSWKGQHDFIEAMSMVMQNNKNVYAVMAGDAFAGEEWRVIKLKEDIDSSSYKERFRFLGFRSDSEALYRIFDIFVLPSTNPDPLPTVVLEAMSSGCPIIAYQHGGVCEMVKDGDNGLLVPIHDINQLADKISLLLINENMRIGMKNSSRKRLCEKFSLNAFKINFSNLYFSLK